MEEIIAEFFKQDFTTIILSIFIIMSAIISIVSIIGKFSEIIGKPVKWIKNKNKDHDLLLNTSNQVTELQNNNKQIKDKLENLTNMILDQQIDSMRYEILDFTSAVSNGRKYNREAYDHIFRIHQKYEKILEKNGMENGLVDESMKFVHEAYYEKLKNGEII